MPPQVSLPSFQGRSPRKSTARRRQPSRLHALLLATSALVSAALTTAAHATDATWLANPASGDFNTATNWNGNAVPDGTAFFNTRSSQRDITFSSENTTLGGIRITAVPVTADYTFTNDATHTVTLNGIGLTHDNAPSLTFNNNGTLNFQNKSSAGNADINNKNFLTFDNGSSAAGSTITNSSSATISFGGSSTAGNASIQSDGVIEFGGLASGDTGRIAMTSSGSILDISTLTTSGTTVGSIEGSGNVFLGSKVGGNDRSTTFAGVMQDAFSGAGGSLTKVGTGTFTLTGANTYTGATIVDGGALVVDGSIVSSNVVIVNGGGTLAGTGTVASTGINDGGTLVAGHNDGTFGTLTVQGNLGFTSGATYLVQVSPATSGSTNVTGTATLGGATVAANFAPGSYVTKQYTILSAAGGVSGTFGSLVNSNLSPMFKASLTSDANDVFLDVSAISPGGGGSGGNGSSGNGSGGCISGFNVNQCNVARGLVNSFNTVGGIPAVFATLTQPGLLTQASGETAVGTQQATFDAMNQFMNVLLDPTAGALSGGRARDALAAMPRKAAPLAEPFEARWGVWAAGYGGSQSVNGDNTLGSNKTTSSVFGSAVGADYRFSPNTVAGFALAGGGTHFNVANGGSGNSDLFQAGAYVRHTQGAAFLSAALAYGWQDVTTNRTVTVAGIDSLRGRFNANALSGRLEGGYKVATAAMDVITPYAAGQFVTYRLPSYAEQAAFGTGTFALNYSGKDVTATRTELGVKTETSFAQVDSVVTLRGRLAWAHDYNTDRNVQAAFLTLPGSAFVVNGAQPAADTALASLSAETIWRSGWAASATFDSQLSDTTRSYAAKGVVRYTW
jgi:autotransporter-associated beta strand protein